MFRPSNTIYSVSQISISTIYVSVSDFSCTSTRTGRPYQFQKNHTLGRGRGSLPLAHKITHRHNQHRVGCAWAHTSIAALRYYLRNNGVGGVGVDVEHSPDARDSNGGGPRLQRVAVAAGARSGSCDEVVRSALGPVRPHPASSPFLQRPRPSQRRLPPLASLRTATLAPAAGARDKNGPRHARRARPRIQ